MLNSGKETYVISPCDSQNKYSDSYLNCTGVVVSGVDKETGKNISFMSHQNPEWFLDGIGKTSGNSINTNVVKFKQDLAKNINELKNRCISGTVDAVIFGGNKEDFSSDVPDEKFIRGFDNEESYNKESYDNYVNSIKVLRLVISNELGFSPVVMSGPNDNFTTGLHSLTSYYDNENKRLYMIRPKQDVSVKNEPYIASDIEGYMDRLKNEK